MEENPQISLDELDKALHGRIPWTGEGLMTAMGFAEMLSELDEEDLPEEFTEAVKGVDAFLAPPDEPMDPFDAARIVWLYTNYGDQGYVVVLAHTMRLRRAEEFVSDHFDELANLGLIERDEEDETAATLTEGLIEALATVPFTQPVVDGDETSYTFAFGDVVAAARRILKDQADAPPGQ